MRATGRQIFTEKEVIEINQQFWKGLAMVLLVLISAGRLAWLGLRDFLDIVSGK